MSYEQFRHSILSRLMDSSIPAEILNRVMVEVDTVAQEYKIERECTDLSVYTDGIPTIVKIYIAALAVQNCAKSTLEDYTRGLRKFFGAVHKPYTMVTTNDIRLYLFGVAQSRGWKASTTEHNRIIVNSFFTWLVDNEYLNRNPARNIEPIRVHKAKKQPLQQIELERLRDACHTPRERALVDVLFSSGVRVSEAAALKTEDIDWTNRTIHVRHGKGDKERFTFFNPEAEVSLKRYFESRTGNSEYVFCKSRAPYTGVSREILEREIKRIRDRILDQLSVKATPHTLRRTTATIASDRGMPVEEIQVILGHESLETTMRYVTVSDSRVKMDYSRYMAG